MSWLHVMSSMCSHKLLSGCNRAVSGASVMSHYNRYCYSTDLLPNLLPADAKISTLASTYLFSVKFYNIQWIQCIFLFVYFRVKKISAFSDWLSPLQLLEVFSQDFRKTELRVSKNRVKKYQILVTWQQNIGVDLCDTFSITFL